MRKFCLTLLPIAILWCQSPAHAWGAIGHRVTGVIAEDNLSGVARAQVRQILGTETLAQASTWPDEQRANPSEFWQKTASPWHYVTIPTGTPYTDALAPPQGDAVTALARFAATLHDPHAALDDKRLALRFIVHIIGDLHMPLHAGRPGDRGGNDIAVTWFGKPTNLHMVWDAAMIDDRQLSWSELAAWLEHTITPDQVIAWSDARPATWIAESVTLRETVYPADPKLAQTYTFQFRQAVDTRLSMAGIRIAAYLNRLFAEGQADKP
ncbi:S1/P1 nuclease [Novosphingobium sp.]|uniref:S1/P1 nuclease n=1 Tax=Novosphingobium sp. TaxID=1874826 RepID=UPI00333FFA03